MSGTYELRLRRSPWFGVVAGFGFGLFFLALGFNRPTIANMRTIDLIHLLATGACLGVGLAALIMCIVGRRQGEPRASDG
jgi:hypothetical protein